MRIESIAPVIRLVNLHSAAQLHRRLLQGYELGMFHFIAMDWSKAREHFSCVYISIRSDKAGPGRGTCNGDVTNVAPEVKHPTIERQNLWFFKLVDRLSPNGFMMNPPRIIG